MQYHATKKQELFFFIIQSLSKHINYSINLILIIDMTPPIYFPASFPPFLYCFKQGNENTTLPVKEKQEAAEE